jgi:hypothetical protein
MPRKMVPLKVEMVVAPRGLYIGLAKAPFIVACERACVHTTGCVCLYIWLHACA